jgi:hypothetical protein
VGDLGLNRGRGALPLQGVSLTVAGGFWLPASTAMRTAVKIWQTNYRERLFARHEDSTNFDRVGSLGPRCKLGCSLVRAKNGTCRVLGMDLEVPERCTCPREHWKCIQDTSVVEEINVNALLCRLKLFDHGIPPLTAVWDLSIPTSVRGSSSAHLSWRGKPVGSY